MKKSILILVILLCGKLSGQSLSVFDVDTSNFPHIKAKFYAFDANGKQITNLSPSDFSLTENGVSRKVTNVTCPAPKPDVPLSSVLTIDISGSMEGQGIALAKAGAKAWLNAMNFTNSECAITAFNGSNYFIHDFTNNKNKLLTAIDNLKTDDGTDYNAAFINPQAGALLASQSGKHRKVVVFISDGGQNFEPNTQEIINQAKAIGASVYGVIVFNPAPQSVIDICSQTGGMLFDNMQDESQIISAYLKILHIIQNSEPCTIEWESGINCSAGMINLQANLFNNISEIQYYTPFLSIARLMINPLEINFQNKPIGIKSDTNITITAVNSDFTITNILSSDPNFIVSPTNFILKSGQSLTLKVSFIPPDSGRFFTTFNIQNNLCTAQFYSAAFYRKVSKKSQNLKLTSPNGGEKFLVGSDSIISWSGILPSDTVKIEFSMDNGLNWNIIADKATGLKYYWKNIPAPASTQCLIRITSKFFLDNDIEWEKVYGGNKEDIANSIIQTNDGGFLVAGHSFSNNGDVIGNHGNYWDDYWIVKINNSGIIDWQKCIGSDDIEEAYDICELNDLSYVVVGKARSNGDDVTGIHTPGYYDYWIVKLDINGNIIWKKALGGTYDEIPYSIVKTIDGGFIVAGSSGSNDGDVTGHHYVPHTPDFWIIKMTSDGIIEWQKSLGGSEDDIAYAICQTKDGSYAVAGVTASWDGDVTVQHGAMDIWIVKMKPNGDIEWQKILGGKGGNIAQSIKETIDGGFIVAGYSCSNGGDVTGNHGSYDAWIVKLNKDGNINWEKSYGGSNDDRAYSISETSDCGYIFCGYTNSNNGDVINNHGDSDFWIVKLNIIGEIEWQKVLGGKYDDAAYSIIESNDGGYIAVGYKESNSKDYYIVNINPKSPIQSDVSDSLFSIVAPQALIHDIDMGNVLVGYAKDSVIKGFVNNIGTYQVRIDSIGMKNNNSIFRQLGNTKPYILDIGKKSDVEFEFKPPGLGKYSDTIFIYYQNDRISCQITGEGVEPSIKITTNLIDFGKVQIPDKKDSTVLIIQNISTTNDVNITSVELMGPDKEQFEILNPGGFLLKKGDSKELNLRFKPKYIGRTSCDLGFYYSGTGSPARTQLFGTGIGGLITVSNDSAFPGEKRLIQLKMNNIKPGGFAKYCRQNKGYP